MTNREIVIETLVTAIHGMEFARSDLRKANTHCNPVEHLVVIQALESLEKTLQLVKSLKNAIESIEY